MTKTQMNANVALFLLDVLTGNCLLMCPPVYVNVVDFTLKKKKEKSKNAALNLNYAIRF